MKSVKRIEIIRAVSGQYLCEHIPLNWFEMDRDDQDEFIESNVWEPLEYALSPDDVYDCIIGAADSVISLLRARGVEIDGSDPA